jgi:hypothetical protein
LLALLGAHPKLHVSRIRFNYLYSSLSIIQLDQIQKNKMGRACGTYGGGRKMNTGFLGGEGKPEEKYHVKS